jgi:hypothetical protein
MYAGAAKRTNHLTNMARTWNITIPAGVISAKAESMAIDRRDFLKTTESNIRGGSDTRTGAESFGRE